MDQKLVGTLSSEGERVEEGESKEMEEAKADPVLGRIGKFGKFQARVSPLSYYLLPTMYLSLMVLVIFTNGIYIRYI